MPDTARAGIKTRSPRRARQSAQPSRYGTQLARSRAGAEVLEPIVSEQAARRAVAATLTQIHFPLLNSTSFCSSLYPL
jgi:hypothetical protein